MVWGKCIPAARSLAEGALPIGLAHGIPLTRPVRAGEVLRWADVRVDAESEAVRLRRAMEEAAAPGLRRAAE
jgi:predicted homoserine dehydrogenase-like protein